MTSAGTCEIVLPKISSNFPTTGHAMPWFQEKLVVVGPMCDSNCTVIFSKKSVNIYSPNGTPLITGWCEPDEPCLWCMPLLPNTEDMPPLSLDPEARETSLQVFSDCDLPSVEAPVRYFHADAGLPVRSHQGRKPCILAGPHLP